MKPNFIDLNGTRIAYEESGTGEPLILLHSGVADMRLWNPQMEVFSKYFQVIRYDARGYGKSSEPREDFHHYKDLESVMDFLGIKSAHLLGLSMGGGTSIDFAISHPDRVRSMVLVGSGVGGWVFKDPFTQQLLDKAEAALEDKNPDLAMQLFLTIWLAGPNRSWDDLDPKLRRLAIDMAPRIDVDPIGREMPLEPVALHRLEEVKAPTLVIIGDGDTLELIEISNILSAKISNAKKVAMAGVAHYPNVENSAEFNEIVLEFLNALP